ncbi:MAG TPA: hypothetical protein VGH38_09905 [Bryobacteraceae bacterium]|jgi:hypothetical protein
MTFLAVKKTGSSLALLFAAAGMLAAADNLPKGETILDKYVEVSGGKAAYDKIHSEITSGTMDFAAMGLKGSMVTYAAEPDKHLTEVTLPGVGKLLDGAFGDLAWTSSAIQGPRIKDGDEKAQSLLAGRFHADAHWRDMYKSAETVGTETVDGKDCYKVVVTPKAGPPITRWYDKQSNLLLKMSFTSKTPMGDVEAVSNVSDYRKEGDILLPHKVVSKAAGMEFSITIDKVEYNAQIPKDKFEVPDDIKALQKK